MQAMTWPMMKLLGLSCRQFAVLTSLRLDRPLTFIERLCFHMHSLLCHVCRPLPKQLENLRRLTRCCDQSHNEEPAATASLPPEAEERIREALRADANAHRDS